MRDELWADLRIRAVLMAVCVGATYWAYSNAHAVFAALGAGAVGGLLGGSVGAAIRRVRALRKKEG
jgi:hypothetical protein